MTAVAGHDVTMFEWHDLLPAPYRQPAYLFGEEYAWPRDMAIEVISLLGQQGRRVIGVDTWLPTRPGPTPVVYDWDEHRSLEVPGFGRTPSEFVRAFSWALAKVDERELQPHFNLTVE